MQCASTAKSLLAYEIFARLINSTVLLLEILSWHCKSTPVAIFLFVDSFFWENLFVCLVCTFWMHISCLHNWFHIYFQTCICPCLENEKQNLLFVAWNCVKIVLPSLAGSLYLSDDIAFLYLIHVIFSYWISHFSASVKFSCSNRDYDTNRDSLHSSL